MFIHSLTHLLIPSPVGHHILEFETQLSLGPGIQEARRRIEETATAPAVLHGRQSDDEHDVDGCYGQHCDSHHLHQEHAHAVCQEKSMIYDYFALIRTF